MILPDVCVANFRLGFIILEIIMADTKKTLIKKLIFTSIVILLPIALGFALWDKLPEEIPQQYGWNGQVNWTLPKFWGIITLPIFIVIINAIYIISFAFSKQKFNPRVEAVITWILPMISVPMYLLLIIKPLVADFDMFIVVGFLISLIFVVLGNYIPKVGPNPVVGTRAPWINKYPEVWYKTQRTTAFVMFFVGILNMVTCFFPFGKYVFVATVIPAVLFSLIYSLVIYRKVKKSSEN